MATMPRLPLPCLAHRTIALALVVASGAMGQCDPVFLAGDASAGIVGTVSALTRWDLDGPGPQPELIVAAGSMVLADNVPVRGIAGYDPVANVWHSFGSGVDGTVQALLVLPTGELLVGGTFTSAGGLPVGYLATWNGSSWSSFGNGGVNSRVHSLALAANGDVVCCGDFWVAGNVAVNRIARWNGTTWSDLGPGITHGLVRVACLPNGDVVGGGGLLGYSSHGVLEGIARWDGTSWWPIPGLAHCFVQALRAMPNGDLLVGGSMAMTNAGPIHGVMRWNGAVWNPIGTSPSIIYALDVLANGDIVAGGSFSRQNGVISPNISRWDGTSWSPMAGGADNLVRAVVATAASDVFVGGDFGSIGGVVSGAVARWSSQQWTSLGSGRFGSVPYAAVHLPGGQLVLAGAGLWSGGAAYSGDVVQWDGQVWSSLGNVPTGVIFSLSVAPNGDLVAAGQFSSIQGIPATNIALWNGTAWTALPSGGPTSYLRDTAVLPNGDIVCADSNTVWTCNRVTWSRLPSLPQEASDLLVTRAGDLLAVGSSYVARWTGAAWAMLGSGVGGYALVELANRDLVVAGALTVQRFDGTGWHAIAGAPDYLRGMLALPDGDLLVGGSFAAAGGVPAHSLARWNGLQWSAVAGGAEGEVRGFTAAPTGEVVVFGALGTCGGHVAAYLARLRSPCPATTVQTYPGCPSSGGANTLTASLAWIGSTWTASGTGLPANGFTLACTGFVNVALPLQLLSPQGQPGCLVQVAPQSVVVLLPQQGRTTLQSVIPNQPALVGTVFHHQLIPVEVDTAGRIVALTASNALSMQVGVF